MTNETLNKVLVYADAYSHIRELLNERERRIFLGSGAIQFGYGSISVLSQRTGVAISTIRRGMADSLNEDEWDCGRVRRIGAGRKPIEETYPDIKVTIQKFLEDETYGSPEGGKWYTSSLRSIAEKLEEKGIHVEKSTVQRIVAEIGYSRQQNRKMEQVGEPDPDKDAQFEFINSQSKEALNDGIPVISVDTKKKENIGNFKNEGTEYRPIGQPRTVLDHDFFIPELGKVAPYGIYVLNNNTGFVNLGTSADTGLFAMTGIRRWWDGIGKINFGYTNRIIILCDSGGSNGYRNRLWKLSLAALADEIGVEFEVLHYPPGTSKYNKVEHRLFCYISKTWQGKPLIDIPTVVNLIQSTTTSAGLNVACTLDLNTYQTGVKVSEEAFDSIDIEYIGPHKGWSYIIRGFKL